MKSLRYANVYVAALMGAALATLHLPKGGLELEALMLRLQQDVRELCVSCPLNLNGYGLVRCIVNDATQPRAQPT